LKFIRDIVVIASGLKQAAVEGAELVAACTLVLIHAAGANTTMWLGQTILDLEY
jgi:hypothetical protein